MIPMSVLRRTPVKFIHQVRRIQVPSRLLALLLIAALMSPTWALAGPLTGRPSGPKTSEGGRSKATPAAPAPRLSAVPPSSLKTATPEARDSVGTEFWLAAPAISPGANATVELNITGDTDTEGSVSVAGSDYATQFAVTAGSAATVEIPYSTIQFPAGGGAIHVTAGKGISVYVLERGEEFTSSYVGLPIDALGFEYIALGSHAPGTSNEARLSVTATVDETILTINPSFSTDGHPAGESYSMTLNEGQTFLTGTGGAVASNDDITGTVISSDKPVAVFSGFESRADSASGAAAENTPVGAGFVQLPPTDTWGRNFIAAVSNAHASGDLLRILALTDGTRVHINGAEVAELARGQVHEQMIMGSAQIVSDQPLLVAQYAPAPVQNQAAAAPLTLVPATGQFFQRYMVTTPAEGFSQNFVQLIVPSNSVGDLALDGVTVQSFNFTPAGNGEYSIAQFELRAGAHQFSCSAPFGTNLYGTGERGTYAYTAGVSFAADSEGMMMRRASSSSSSSLTSAASSSSTCTEAAAAIVRHAPTINGRIIGSAQMLTGEYVNFNSGSIITSDLMVPGTPGVQINGTPNYQGTIDSTGSAQPSNYQVTLNSGSQLRHLIRRTNPVGMASVPVPPAPAGTRSVTVDSAGYNVGNWATVRDLTLNAGVGSITVPPGTYNNFTANDHTSLIFGVAGATTPSVYNLDTLTLNSNSGLQLLGPVIINLGSRMTVNSGVVAGASQNPRWLSINVARYDVTVNSLGTLYGMVNAPSGTVYINGRLVGSTISNNLSINSGGVLEWMGCPAPANQPPTVSAGQNQTVTLPNSANLAGTASDDGLPTGSTLSTTWSKLSGPGTVSFTNPNAVVTTASFSATGTYVLRLTASDSQLTSTSDVTITVKPANQPPTVSAGQSQTITLPDPASLQGMATDDGLPAGGTLSVTWSKVTGPGTVTFANASATQTTATFSSAGTYVLRLTANDSQLTATSDVTVTVNPQNQAPTVSAGTNQTITLPSVASLQGTASDDGLPVGGTLATTWSKLSGPGAVVFANPNATATTATFTTAGTYVLRLTASDSQLTSTSDVTITVNPENHPPTADAGPDQTVTLPAGTVSLNGSVSDDGLPTGSSVSSSWSLVTGAGNVTFANPNSAATTASFTEAGNYVLRLTASDSQLSSSDYVTIVVKPQNHAPVAIAGPDQTITLPSGVTLNGTVNDDGLPANNLASTWSKVSGPGDVAFANPNVTVTAASFSQPGTYVLRLMASDTELTGSDDITVTVNLSNQAPVVNAGSDQTIVVPNYQVLFYDDFENGMDKWEIQGLSVLTTAYAYGGTHSQTFNRVTGGGDAHSVLIPVTPGSIYYLHADYMTLGGGGQVATEYYDQALQPVFYDAQVVLGDGGFPTRTTFDYSVFKTNPADLGVWKLYTQAITIPPGVYFIRINTEDWDLGLPNDPTGHGVYFDNIELSTKPDPMFESGPLSTVTLNGTVTDDGLPAGGALNVSWSKVSGPGTVSFENASQAVTSVSFSEPGTYVLRLSASDTALTESHDVTVTVNPESNHPPLADAGTDQFIKIPNVASLQGRVADDGVPAGGALTATWSKVSGPGTVTFDNPNAATTTAAFSAGGLYVLRLTATDSQFSASDDVIVRVNPPNLPPVVDAGPDQNITLPHVATLSGTMTDDGVPSSFVRTEWYVASGPGPVTFSDQRSLSTTAKFRVPGRYILLLEGIDEQIRGIDIIVVNVNPAPPNQAPMVSAGPDQTISMNGAAHLGGTVTDDDLPMDQPLTSSWTKVSGPGTVTFSSSSAPTTTALFSAPGTYVLRLAASDTQFSASDEVTVTVDSSPGAMTYQVALNAYGAAFYYRLGETSGDPQDVSGNHIPARIQGSFMSRGVPGLLANDTDKAAAFNGGSYISVPASDGTNPVLRPGALTLTCLFKPAAVGRSDLITFNALDYWSQGRGFHMLINQNMNLHAVWDQGGAPFTHVVGTTVLQVGQTYHLAAVSDGTSISIYLNGHLEGSTPAFGSPSWLNAVEWQIGGNAQSGGPGEVYANGVIDEAAMIGLPLSADQILSLANIALTPPAANQPPVVDAGPDQSGTTPERSNSKTFLMDLNGNITRRLTLDAFDSYTANWSPQNNRIVFSSNRDGNGEIYVMDADGRNQTRLTYTSAAEFGPYWSPDGTQIIYTSNESGNNDVFVIDADGSNRRRLTNSAADDQGGVWRPKVVGGQVTNGEEIVFTSRRDGNLELYAMDPDGSNQRRLTFNPGQDDAAVWLPDGSALAFSSRRDADADLEIYLMNPDGTNVRRVLGNPGDDFLSDWSHDGTKLSLINSNGGNTDVYTANADGSQVKRLTNFSGEDSVAYFSPDDTRLVISSRRDGVYLSGRVTDDGLPANALTIAWTKVSGPGNVTFENPNAATTRASFDAPGTYVLRLTASDTQATSSDDVTVVINPQNQPPTVLSGQDQTVLQAAGAKLHGLVTDDGLLATSSVSVTWSKESGPGSVTFGKADSAFSDAAFSAAGSYVLRLTANDGQLSSSDTLTITVVASNAAPAVNAGPDQTITLPSTATLQGAVSDDGLPSNNLSSNWSKVSGPGTVVFGNVSAAATTAMFDQPGLYVLRLAASDTDLSASDDVQVMVSPVAVNQPPSANAGSDQAVALNANLIVNPGGELPLLNGEISGWTEVAGNGWSQAPAGTGNFPESLQGSAYFYAGQADTAELRQDVDVSAFAGGIAAGTQQFSFKAGVRSANETVPDVGRVILEYRDASNQNVIATLDSGPITSVGGWQLTEDARAIPAGTGFIRIRLIATRNSGLTNDAYFDDLSLRPVGAAAVKLGGAATDDGLPAGNALTFTWSKVSGPGAVSFGDASAQTSSAVITEPGTYVLRLTASDGLLSGNDEVTVTVTEANQAPAANAGADQTITLPASANLNGTVTDDGIPSGSSVSTTWSKVSGPGAISFGDANRAATTATFDAPGTYVLRLTASDTDYEVRDEVTITVNAQANQPPAVNAGADQTITLPVDTVTLNGTATDDGLPAGSTLSVTWSRTSGPGAVTFGTPDRATTTAQFSVAGTYTLRLTASDTEATVFDEVVVTVEAQNHAPTVNAGADQTINQSQDANLNGTVSDDGLPTGSSVSTTWSKVSGPGAVTFADPSVTVTTATFSEEGTYVLRLTATDSELTGTDDITVKVDPAQPRPMVEIISPADGAEITSPVDVVGSVSNGAWKLEYALNTDDGAATQAWTTLATGSGAVNSSRLGTLDTTLMLNGNYSVRLSSTDQYGQTSLMTTSVIVDRNLKVGNFTVSFSDLQVPVAGLPIEVTRTYDSRDKRTGDFGAGWTLGIKNVRVEKSGVLGQGWFETASSAFIPTYCLQPTRPHRVTITFGDGKVYKFEASTARQCQQAAPITATNLTFTPIAPTHGTLSAAGPTDIQVAGSIPGPVDLIGLSDPDIYNTGLFRLTVEDGTVYTIDQKLGVRSVADPYGNTLTIDANGITHSGGKSIAFTRDAAGRITQITDPAGKTQTYAYDASGDLVSYKDPENNVVTYGYTGNHYLASITDPRGLQPIRNEYDESGRLITQTDAFGKVINYGHDLVGRVETVTDRLGNPTRFEYDDHGNVLRQVDAKGGVKTFTYDEHDNMLTETNALGKTTTYTYDAQDNRTSVTDPLGNTTHYTYNLVRQPLTMTDALGHVTTNTYDAAGNNILTTKDAQNHETNYTYSLFTGQRTSMTDALDNVTGYEYTNNYLTKVVDAYGNETTYFYDAKGNRVSETTKRTSAQGQAETITTTHEYDALNRRVKTTYPDGTFTQTEYNSIGQQGATIDQQGRRTTFDYDEMGRLVKTTYPDGTKEESTFDAEGHRLTSKDRAGRVTSYVYDEVGRLIKTTYPDGTFTATTYNAVGQVLTSTDALSHVTRYEYDAAGRRTQVTNALNQASVFTYDGNGNQLTMTDAGNHTVTYEYDELNRRTKVKYADGTSETTAYDALGRSVSRTDQAGKTTQFEYDKLGRLVKVTDALDQITQYGYDELGQQVSQTDANNHVTRYEYDKLGRRVKRILPVGQSETYSYDTAGNLQSRTDFNGKTTTYGYDTMRRLLTKTPDASLNQTGVTYTYNTLGQRATMTDASGITTYTYDARNRLKTRATPEGTLTYTYDNAGNLKTTRSSNLNGVTVDYAYDELNRLSTVADNRLAAGANQTTYSYDTVGNLQSYLYPNGVQTTYAYNSLNRLTDLTASHGATALASYAYTLGAAGNRLSVTEENGRTVNYTYDSLYRLTNEAVTNDPNAANNGAIEYSYDAVGNRLSRTSTLTGVASSTSTYDANDRLESDQSDANGNTITSNGTTYSFDWENHLTSVNNGSVSYVYDGDGLRVGKTVGGVTTRYLVDTNNPSGYAQVVDELTGPQVTRQYTYGHDLVSENQVINGEWVVSYYGYDGHGSTRYLTDSTGAVSDTYTYDAFGSLINQTGTTPNEYLYSGEQLDANLGFYYLRARYLNPESGRFLSMDSYEGVNGDPSSLHKYLYANVNPINKIDPSGNSGIALAVGIIAGLAALAVIGSLIYFRYYAQLPAQIVSFEWRNQWTLGRETLNSSEINTVKTVAVDTFKRAFAGFGVVVSDAAATNRIIVDSFSGDAVGMTPPAKIFSYVYYDSISISARKYAAERGITDRGEIIHGIGQGVGAVAAHEFGHQGLYGGFVDDNTKDPSTYDYHSGDRWQLYFGELHWSSQALEKMKQKLPH